MIKPFKKWQKLVATIVLIAFLFQAGPIYATEQIFLESSLPKEETEDLVVEESREEAPAEGAPSAEETEEESRGLLSIFDGESDLSTPRELLTGEETATADSQRKIDGELEELREADVKYFLNKDKTITAATYPYDVHYLTEEGTYEEIDNSLVDGADVDSGDVLENTESNVRIKFSKKAKENNMVKIELDGHKITWGLLDADKNQRVRDCTKTQLNFNNDPLFLTDKTATVAYSAVYPDVDLYYDVMGTTVKERIELLHKDAAVSYSFRYATKDLSLKEKDGNLVLEDASGQEVFTMAPLVMYDAAGEVDDGVAYHIETVKDHPNNHEYILTITADKTWLQDEEREYPVTIDPTISVKNDGSNFYDAHVNSESPEVKTNSAGTCMVGTNPNGTSYIYTKFTLPSAIKESDRIVSAVLAYEPFTNDSKSIFGSNISNGPYICAYETLADWVPDDLNWNNKPAFGSEIIDYDHVNSTTRWYTWDITDILQGSGLADRTYGVTLRSYKDEAFSKRCYFYSANSHYGTGTYPFVEVTYLNMIGLEDHWTYHSQAAGLAGSGYVNDFTGNLTAVFEDFSVDSERLPMSVAHVYTGYNAGKHMGSLDVGSGFRLSIQETVEKKTISGTTKYLYTDGDGTEHYFEKDSSGKWVDDSGLDLQLTVGASEYTITDKKDNKRIFSVATTYLTSIKDNDGNTLTLNYNSSNQLTSIADDSGRTITFQRTSGTNRLSSMTYNGRTIYYAYIDSGNGYGACLTQVTFPGGSTLSGTSASSGSQIAKFVYTASGSLTDLIDATQNIGIHYGYLWQNNTRRVNEYSVCTYSGTTPTLKNRYTIEYRRDHNIYRETAVSSGYPLTGRNETYYFNSMGQTISAQDQDGNALYSEQGLSGGAKNKVTFASKTQKTITNLLKNHSFEGTFGTNYSTYGTAANVTVMTATTTYPSLYGSKLLRITAGSAESGARQSVSVKGGQCYTLSAYIRTTSSAKAVLQLSSSYSSEIARDAAIQQVGSYKRYDVTLDLSNASSANTYTLTANFAATGSGYVLFDGVQLEAGECSNRYNMIENGGFEGDIAANWSYTNQNADNPSGVYDGAVNAAQSGSKSLLLNGQPKQKKFIYQILPVSGKKNEGFVFGTWVKSNAIPNKDTAKDGSKQAIAMTLEFLSSSGASVGTSTILLPPTPNQWTYACGSVMAQGDFASVKVYLKANYSANQVYFDDVQVYKDTFGESFVYDSKGNVTTVTDMAQSTQNAVYGNNDLTSYTDGNGYTYSFVYNGGDSSKKTHNLTKTTAPDGTYTAMAYFGNGLLQYVSVYDTNGTTAIRTTKTYGSGSHYLATSVDQLQKTTTYNYNVNSGLLNSVTEPYGSGSTVTTSYGYNNERLTSVAKDSMTASYAYSQNRMSSIGITGSSKTTTYHLNYTALGNLSSIARSANGGSAVTLESYAYDEARGNQTDVTYGNGQSLHYTYDNQDRMVGVASGSAPISELVYNSNGLLGKAYSYDDPNQTTWNKYDYDFAERYVGTQSSEGFGTHNITYDKNNNNTGYTATLNGLAYSTQYYPNSVNRQYRMDILDSNSTAFGREYVTFDGGGRTATVRNYSNISATNDGVWTAYSYLDPKTGGNTSSSSTHTTNLASEMRIRYSSTSTSGANADYKYNYGYDDAGNIKSAKTTLKNGTSYTANFTYDARGQLTRVYDLNNNNNYYNYTYDKRGNITKSTYGTNSTGSSYTNCNTYTYNSAIPDELSSVTMEKGSTTTTRSYVYDTISNPTRITDTTGSTTKEKTLTWEQGKQLRSVNNNGTTKTFYYDESGRVKKAVLSGGSYTKYHYDSDNLEYEEHYTASGSLSYLIKYFYDDQDRLQYALYKDCNFTNSAGYYNLYTYIYNGFGEITDIVKLRNGLSSASPSIVNQLVAHYEYDPYGNITKETAYNSDTFLNVNPIKYKAYYYDKDLSWYRLDTRYYDPSIGRFINCDDISLLLESSGDITDKNLYAYCDNNPIMRTDKDGEFWHIVAGAAIGMAVEVASSLIAGQKPNLIDVAAAGINGAASAAFGLAGAAVVSGITNTAANALKSEEKMTGKSFAASFVVGAGLSLVGGGLSKSTLDGSTKWIGEGINKVYRTLKSGIKPKLSNIKQSMSRFRDKNKWSQRSRSTRLRDGLSIYHSAKYSIYHKLYYRFVKKK